MIRDASMSMNYVKASDVVKRKIAGELFLVPVKQNLADMQNLFVLHGCGEFIWDQLEGEADVDEIARRLSDSYEVSLDDASRDTKAFIAELSDAKLVKSVG